MRTEEESSWSLYTPPGPSTIYILAEGKKLKMTAYTDPGKYTTVIDAGPQHNLKTLYDYVAEKLPSVHIHALHEIDQSLSFHLGGSVKRKYWERVLLPMLTSYAKEWGAELRYSFSEEFGVATRWYWEGPFVVTPYPDNTPLLANEETSKQEQLLDNLVRRIRF